MVPSVLLAAILAQAIRVGGLEWPVGRLEVRIRQTAPDVLEAGGSVACIVKARMSSCANVYFVQFRGKLAVMAGNWKYNIPGRQSRQVGSTTLYYIRSEETVELSGDCGHLDLEDAVESIPLEDPSPVPFLEIVTPRIQAPRGIEKWFGVWMLGCGQGGFSPRP